MNIPVRDHFHLHSGEDYFIRIVFPADLLDYMEDKETTDPALLSLLGKITEEDNPILILYKLK